MEKAGFIKYLESKDLSQTSIMLYVKHTEDFFAKTKKEDLQIVKPDILTYLEYLKNKKGLQNSTRSIYLLSLNHYFTYLYQSEKIAQNPCLFLKIQGKKRKRLYKIYTSEELDLLFDNYYQLFVRGYDDSHYRHEQQKQYSVLGKERNALILSILFNQGITTKEISKIELNDIDLIKASLKIRGGNILNDRILPLKATQIGLFMNYLQNIRPQLLEYQATESNKLFLLVPIPRKKQVKNDNLKGIFYPLTEQVKTIDKQFINFLQVRASVITFWIKTKGLRKAQYLAGHRSISNTENYLSNNLDGLINDINKLHPFDF